MESVLGIRDRGKGIRDKAHLTLAGDTHMPSSLKKVAVRPDDAVESEKGGVRSGGAAHNSRSAANFEMDKRVPISKTRAAI